MSLANLKRIAAYRVRRSNIGGDEIIDFLKSWWSQKYNRPDNDPLLLEKRIEELVIEYYEDMFRLNPEKLSEFEVNIGEIHEDSDESWFKKVMGDQYTPENKDSDESLQEVKTAKEGDKESFEDVYNTLG